MAADGQGAQTMLRLLLDLLPCLTLGLLLGHRHPGLPQRLSPPLIHWGVPLSLVGLLLRSGLNAELLVAVLMALFGVASGLLLLAMPPLRRRIPSASLRLGAVVGNTAYWGLPVALALLPPAAISHVIAYDLAGTLFTWTVGPLLSGGLPAGAGALLAVLRSNPASRGLLLALVLQLTPWAQPLAALLWWPARLVLLIALTVVGMRLGAMLRQRRDSLPASPGLAAALLAKLLLLPALLLGVALLLHLPATVRNAVVLQAAAPTAISVLLLAEAARGDAVGSARLVLWSTGLGLLSVPLWWELLRRLDAF
jgi:hypothetical protein